LRLSEDDADALDHVGVLKIYKILKIYVVHLLVWIMDCTKCTILTAKYKNILITYSQGCRAYFKF